MNARLYDPVIGRFLSPDPQLQEPYSSQNYNRYSYCLNNPLKYNDPNGEFIFGIFNFVKDLFVNTFIKSWSKGINAWTKKRIGVPQLMPLNLILVCLREVSGMWCQDLHGN